MTFRGRGFCALTSGEVIKATNDNANKPRTPVTERM